MRLQEKGKKGNKKMNFRTITIGLIDWRGKNCISSKD